MSADHAPTLPQLRQQLAHTGFLFEHGARMRELIAKFGALSDWNAFASSWDDLAVDAYLVDARRFRRRRHAVFVVDARGGLRREPHQPHYQAREYNALYGGIERWFEPIDAAIAAGPSLRAILRFCAAFFGALAPAVVEWHVEAHQFRIEARPEEPGLPTPEGVHRDGVDYVLVLLVSRQNIASGTTTVHAADGALLGSFTLAHPFDAALLDDVRVHHGVTAVEPLDSALRAHRDVLVVTLRRRARG